MHRYDVVNGLLSLFDNPNYLEIGVSHGLTFNEIRAARKVAVDPRFQFDTAKAAHLPINAGATFVEVPSDDYFSYHLAAGDQFDMIYLDGLHTFDQTLRDLLNALDCLAPGGVILIDDVLPPSYAASLPTHEMCAAFLSRTNDPYPAWMGDVYRLIFFLRDYLRGYSYATITDNHGQTIVWKQPRPCVASPLPVADIARIDYSGVVLGMDAFAQSPFAEVADRLRAWRSTIRR